MILIIIYYIIRLQQRRANVERGRERRVNQQRERQQQLDEELGVEEEPPTSFDQPPVVEAGDLVRFPSGQYEVENAFTRSLPSQ
eukprot:Pgem_evm1s15643